MSKGRLGTPPPGEDPGPSRTLLCVLDWGLGHASRSLALAEELEAAGDRVFFASCGSALRFLEMERPGTQVYELPAYGVSYPTENMPLNVALQAPRWLRTMWREHRQTVRLVRTLGIDRIISDSRFGCYVPGVPSILLTHQLHPIFNFAPLSKLYTRYLQRFSAFWVPDSADQRLSGRLSDSQGYKTVRYIGPLSRLHFPATLPPKTWRTFSLLSGPEPMRTRLEAILLSQLASLPGPHLLVRGIPTADRVRSTANVTIHDFANRDFLEQNLPAAEFIICRPGYSTLLDLDRLPGRQCIFIPTPGQTEQEFLARTQVQRGDAIAAFAQSAVDLASVVGTAPGS